MSRLLRPTAIMALALAASGCATMTVSSHIQNGVDFARYRTYDWGTPDALPGGDARLVRDPFFLDHIAGAVEKQMALKGFERANGHPPDLLVHFHANIRNRIDISRLDDRYGYCYAGDCNTKVVDYEAGTLVLDIIDARTKQVIWRGWAQDSVEDVLDNPDRLRRDINEAVWRMLDRFPDGPAAAPVVEPVDAVPVSH